MNPAAARPLPPPGARALFPRFFYPQSACFEYPGAPVLGFHGPPELQAQVPALTSNNTNLKVRS